MTHSHFHLTQATFIKKFFLYLCFCPVLGHLCFAQATGDLGVIIERNVGGLAIVSTSTHQVLKKIEKLGDLSHAAVVFSRDEQYAYTFQRDGWINQVSLLGGKVVAQTQAGENAIGGAISQDGKYLAVSNYKPGDIKILESETLKIVKVIPAAYTDKEGQPQQSRTVGLVDAPDNLFLFSLLDAGEIWMVEARAPDFKVLQQWKNLGDSPYDALITSEGRYYIAGFLRSNWIVRLDLWKLEEGAKQVSTLDPHLQMPKVPMYKVPHLSGWGIADGKVFIPIISEERLMVYDLKTWNPLSSIQTYGTVVFAVPRPDQRELWLSFAGPKSDTLQILDVLSQKIKATLKLGDNISHLQFTPRGETAYVSARAINKVFIINAYTHQTLKTLDIAGPSGIFFTNRAHLIGQ